MKHFFSLFKLEFLQVTKLYTFQQNKTKFFRFLLLGLILYFSFFVSFYNFYGSLFQLFGQQHLFLPLVFLLCSFLVFFLTVYSAKNTLFESQDKDLLLTLPISSRTIFLSRIGCFFTFSFFLSFFFLLPAFVYCVGHMSVSFLFVLFFCLITLFIAVIPSVFSILFGALLGWILNHVRYKTLFENIFYFGFFFLYFLVYFEMNHWASLLQPEKLLKILKYVFYPIYLLYHGFLTFDFLDILLFLLLSLGILFVFVLVFEKKYFYLLQRLDVVSPNKKYQLKKIKVLSKKKALIKKEWRRIFTTPIYLFQYGFGFFFLILFSIASFFIDISSYASMIPFFGSSSFSLFFFLYFLVIGLANFGCVSYSLERNHFWILKVLPVDEKEVLDSKWISCFLLICFLCFLSLIFFVGSGTLSIPEAGVLFFFSVCFGYFNNLFGLFLNLLFPKMDAPSDVAIIKRSMSSFLGIMVPLVLVCILGSFMENITFLFVLEVGILLILLGTIVRVISIWLLKHNKVLS